MGRLGDHMKALRDKGGKAFVPYLTSGDPSLTKTRELWAALDRAGADVIEIGVPFSDPLADGPTIQRASHRALESGTTLAGVLDALREDRDNIKARTIIFGYYNPVLAMGLTEFASRAGEAGVDGVLIPDLVPEEAGPLREALAPHDMDIVSLVAPTTPDERLELIGKVSPALVYAVSVTGVTGARTDLPPELERFVARCRKHIASPLIVGFGIATPEQAARVAEVADGVVVGSALVKIIEDLGDSPDMVEKVKATARALAQAAKGA